jgi:mRNA-degrading endonuclease RelE of RelBE toxin-antitoxin system
LPWESEITSTFRRGYRKLGPEVRARVDQALAQLLESEDPTELGLRKVGRWKGVYSYEIGRQFRILYQVRPEDHTVVFHDVGTHGVYR